MSGTAPSPAPAAVANTLRLPCSAAAMIEFAEVDELRDGLQRARTAGLTPLPLGEGSNVVLPPRLDRAVLRCVDAGIAVTDETADFVDLRVGAGHSWHALVEHCLGQGWHGLENLALIPGAVGAAPVQNIGAYGVELARFVRAVHGVDLRSGDERVYPAEACEFAYRDSLFKHSLREQFVITAVDLRLHREPVASSDYPALAQRLAERGLAATPQTVFETVVALRRERLPDPATDPNAGSFFKNPVVSADDAQALRATEPDMPVYPTAAGPCKLSAAWLIDACGFKGAERDGVAVSPQHALVLVHRGGGQAALLQLAAEIAGAVDDRFGVALEMEPTVYRGE